MPPLQADVLHEGVKVANASVPALLLSKGWVPITALVESPASATDVTSQFVQNMLTSTPFNLSITGPAGDSRMCTNAVSLLREISFTLQLLKPDEMLAPARRRQHTAKGSSTQVGVRGIDVTRIDDEAIELTARYRLDGLPFPLRGIIPSVVFEYYNEQSNTSRLGYVVASVDLAAQEASLRVVCEQPVRLGAWASAIFLPNETRFARPVGAHVFMRPRVARDVNTATLLLQRWNYTQPLGGAQPNNSSAAPAPTTKPAGGDATLSFSFSLLNASVLGAKGPRNMVLGVGFSLGNTLLNLHTPNISIAVDENTWRPGDSVKRAERLAVVSVSSLDVRAAPSPQQYMIEFSLTTVHSLRDTVNKLFEGGSGDTWRVYGCAADDASLTALQAPDPLVQTHVLQRLLSVLEYRLAAAPAQPNGGAQQTSGGVMPKVNFNLTSSTNDTISARVWLNVSLPLPVRAHLGQLDVQLAYRGMGLLKARLRNTALDKGINQIVVDVTLSAEGANRAELEDLIADYIFGQPIDTMVLTGALSDAAGTFRYGAINITYPFALPAKAAGGASAPLPCLDTLALKPGVDTSNLFSLPLQVPACQVNGQVRNFTRHTLHDIL